MTTRILRNVAIVILVFVGLPKDAWAQKDQFFDALLPLYRALAGTYGDEGPQLTASVETMTTALAQWDATLRDAEAQLRPQSRSTDARAAMQAHTVLASLYSERGRFVEALRELDADIALDPNRAIFHRLKALIELALDRRAEAASDFRAAWTADPDDPQNAYQLIVHQSGSTAAQRTRARETLAGLESALVHGDRPKADMPFISIRAITDDVGGAMAFAPGAYARAAAQLLNGQVDAGLAGLRAAVAADPLTVDPALRLDATRRGISALRQGQVQPAVDAMTVAVAAAPQASEAHRLLATAQIVHGDVDAGIQHLRDAVRLNPKNERAWLALGRILDDIGRTLDAADALRRAVAELPDAGEIRWQLSVISGKRQQTDQADLELIASADRLVLLAGNGELYSRVARLAQAHLDYARGIALLERAVALTPNSAKAHQALGRGYVDQGREDEGYAELVVALWLDPGGAETLAALGRLHLAADRIPQAMDVLTRAVAVEPANAPAVNALGETLLRAGRATEGQERLEESRRLQARAVDAQRRSRTAGMLSLQAELAMTQRDYARAIDTWEQAAEMEPRNITIRLGLADALIATKRLTEAIPALQAATSLDAGADVHRRLADVYAALGRPDDSRRERLAYTEQRLMELRQAAGGSR